MGPPFWGKLCPGVMEIIPQGGIKTLKKKLPFFAFLKMGLFWGELPFDLFFFENYLAQRGWWI